MNRQETVAKVRTKLAGGGHSIGSWMLMPHPAVAEIMGRAGYDWIAVDLEHGAIGVHLLPELFRAISEGGTLPLVRLGEGQPRDCQQALDAGAGGVIIPRVEGAAQLEELRDACRWPPAGRRGVGFSHANHFGRNFQQYVKEAQMPLLVAMVESRQAVESLESVLRVEGLDALLIGPYDLSASLGCTAAFHNEEFVSTLTRIKTLAEQARIPCGLHVTDPDLGQLQKRLADGYRFLAYGIDAVFLTRLAENPIR